MRSATSIIDLAFLCRGWRTSSSDISFSPSATIEDCPSDGGVDITTSPDVTICFPSLPSLVLTWVVEDPELLGKDADETFDNVEDECDDCDLITASLNAESSEFMHGEVNMLIDDCAWGPDGGEWGKVIDIYNRERGVDSAQARHQRWVSGVGPRCKSTVRIAFAHNWAKRGPHEGGVQNLGTMQRTLILSRDRDYTKAVKNYPYLT
jgi:hypothetical protein